MDDFTTEMVQCGLELWLSSQKALCEFVLFLWGLPRFSRELSPVTKKKNGQCTDPLLSRLYLVAHLVLIAIQYGLIENFEIIADLRSVMEGCFQNLLVPLNDLTEEESVMVANIEIVLEILWVLLCLRRLLPDLNVNLKKDFEKVLPLCNGALLKYSNFLEREDPDIDQLRAAGHKSQLWLFCFQEIAASEVPSLVPPLSHQLAQVSPVLVPPLSRQSAQALPALVHQQSEVPSLVPPLNQQLAQLVPPLSRHEEKKASARKPAPCCDCSSANV